MNTITSASFFFGARCNLNTPEMGRSRMNTSDTNPNAPNGSESFWLMLLCEAKEAACQVPPARGVAVIRVTTVVLL